MMMMLLVMMIGTKRIAVGVDDLKVVGDAVGGVNLVLAVAAFY